jgi:hypothetical protein
LTRAERRERARLRSERWRRGFMAARMLVRAMFPGQGLGLRTICRQRSPVFKGKCGSASADTTIYGAIRSDIVAGAGRDLDRAGDGKPAIGRRGRLRWRPP